MFYNTDFSGYRPYGVLYVLKVSTDADSVGVGDTLLVGIVGYHNDTSGFVTSSTADTVTISIPTTEDTYTQGQKYYWDGNNSSADVGYYSDEEEAKSYGLTHYRVYWLDIVLVLNPRVDTTTNKLSGRTDTTYCLMRDGDDYRASFNVSIGGRSIAFAVGGYYNTDYVLKDNPAYLTVNPTAAATNLNLKNDFKDGDTNGVKIGEYSFSTQSAAYEKVYYWGGDEGDKTVAYYFNVSASPIGVANDMPFFIRHVVADKSNTNPINGFYFEIGIASNQGNGTVWYDGTFSDAATMVGNKDYISPKVITESTVRSDEWFLAHWEDSGDIRIRLDTERSSVTDLEKLRSGRYTATIYFNVYSEY